MESDYNSDARLSAPCQSSVVTVSIPVSAGSKLMAIATGFVSTAKVGTLAAGSDCHVPVVPRRCGKQRHWRGRGRQQCQQRVARRSRASGVRCPAGTEMVSLNCSATGHSKYLDHVTLNVWGGA